MFEIALIASWCVTVAVALATVLLWVAQQHDRKMMRSQDNLIFELLNIVRAFTRFARTHIDQEDAPIANAVEETTEVTPPASYAESASSTAAQRTPPANAPTPASRKRRVATK